MSKKKQDQNRARVLVLGHVREPVWRAGGTAVPMAIGDDRALEAVEHDNIHALLLTGGGDVNPARYGQRRHRTVYGVNDERDEVELLAVDAALERRIPVLGICRGHQILNVACGGTLHQNIEDLKDTHRYHGGGHEHRVQPAEGSRLATAFRDDLHYVISIHHQAVDQVADDFVVTGWGLDGTVEAIEAVEGWAMGVQFHPEMAFERPAQQRIFDAFVDAAAKTAGLPKPRRAHIVQAPKPVPQTFDVEREAKRISRPAKRKTLSTWASPVVSRWRCFRCHGLDFDLHEDFVDHMQIMHGVVLEEVTA